MKVAALSVAVSGLAFVQCLPAQVQVSHGACSPNIANVTGNVTINFTGNGCGSIDPDDLGRINKFLAENPAYQRRVLEELSKGNAKMQLLVKQVAQLTAETSATNKEISERLAKVEILAAGPPTITRALQANDQDRRAAAEAIGEIEGILKKGGFGLTPRNLAAVGWLYELSGQYARAAASFLAAKDADSSLAGAVYLGLAVSYQLQGHEFLQKGDVDEAETILAKAADNARLLQQYEPAESSIPLSQLGFIYKELANTYSAEGKKAKAEAALASAATLFQQVLGANPKDAGAHNGLGDVYFARGDTEHAIAEYETATSLMPEYIYAWHDLTLALYTKYTVAPAPDPDTLRKLITALQKVFELQLSQDSLAQKLPPSALEGMMKIKDFAVAEAEKFPSEGTRVEEPFVLSGAASPEQTGAIEAALKQYRKYLLGLGIPLRGGTVTVQVMPESKMYAAAVSYYDPSKDTILVNVKHADTTFWPLRDYTIRALLSDAGENPQPALVAILSGLATYYPSSSKDNPNYGPAYGGELDKFRSLSDLRLDNASADGSSIWGSICWELRKLLGQNNTDRLLFEAWRQMRPPDQAQAYDRQFATKIIDLHKSTGGMQAEAIRVVFERRGLKL